jgi:hypothetical protein
MIWSSVAEFDVTMPLTVVPSLSLTVACGPSVAGAELLHADTSPSESSATSIPPGTIRYVIVSS